LYKNLWQEILNCKKLFVLAHISAAHINQPVRCERQNSFSNVL